MHIEDFAIILGAYFISKFGYMVLFNNFFHLVTLKGKKAKGTYLDKFSKTAGYSIVFLGLATGLVVVFKRYFPQYYLYGYGTIVFGVFAFLLIKFFSYKNEDKELID